MQKLKKVSIILAIIYILMAVILYLLQEKIIFLPEELPKEHVYNFEEPFEEFFLTASDGTELNALHFKVANPKGAILYFHGNAGNLSRWGKITTYFAQKGYDVVVMDYRGYGKNSGKLSEAALLDDAQLFYDYVSDHYPQEDIIIYGRSLGTAIATHVACNNGSRKLILETPFYNLLDVAKKRFAFLPLKQLLKYEFASDQHIKKVKSPIVIFHGTDDSVVPYESGKKLYDAIEASNKTLYTIEQGDHNNLVDFEEFHKGIDLELN